jgi:diguanylate cyclase (GGDEF)-like protein
MIREKMFAALGATNEAILRATTPDELFRRVCEAAVHDGGFLSAGALLPYEGGWLKLAAGAGYDNTRPLPDLKISINADTERGQGLAGPAFRTAQSYVANDFQNDARFRPWIAEGGGQNVGASAAVPIIRAGRSVGVFLFFVSEAGALSPDIVALLERMVENVSFALGSFENDQERKKAERANRRLTDMFAALSATNTAILRSKSAEEMYRLVCESVAKGGRSLGAAAILLAQRDSHFFKVVAAAGEGKEFIEKLQLSTDPDHSAGQGLAGPAFREQQLKISYDLFSDQRTKAFTDRTHKPYGGAAVPLLLDGRSVGVLYFFFGRTSGREDPEMLQLMTDIAANVSFALAGFQREAQKERSGRMFAALSATNEAIMRAQTREELCGRVCDAAVLDPASFGVRISLLDTAERVVRIVAAGGLGKDTAAGITIPIDGSLEQSQSLGELAFKSAQRCISNDYLDDPRLTRVRERVRAIGARSAASFPLLKAERPFGLFTIHSSEAGIFTAELVELLQRLADNLSFAFANFDRADEKARAEQRIEYLATHDSLTGLPNRALFNHLLHEIVSADHAPDRKAAVLFIDLDRFKVINDSLGHEAGDALLMEVAWRLRANVRASDVVARLGGDEFVIILNEIAARSDVETIARDLLLNLMPPVQLAGHQCRTTASIGIAMYPDDGHDELSLTKNADIAMYAAKDEGKNAFRFYAAELRSQSVERLELEAALRHALELDQFTVHYQPKVLATDRRVTGVEALLRWNHPQWGELAPAKFIPVAEESGLITPIGRWVLRSACAQAVAWQKQGLPPLSMAVNLSPRQFQDEHLLRDIDQVLQETGLAPELLQLEITESMVMRNVERAITLLDAIRARGVHLAIDDFGTGYSSMSLMKKFPIDTIKIDRSFVRDLATNKEDRAIARAIIQLGKTLGLTVVAEGVETFEQDLLLRRDECDQLQGYLFSKPVPPEAIPPLVTPHLKSPSLQPQTETLTAQGERRSQRALR